MGIPTEILWEWDGNGNENSLPTATLVYSNAMDASTLYILCQVQGGNKHNDSTDFNNILLSTNNTITSLLERLKRNNIFYPFNRFPVVDLLYNNSRFIGLKHLFISISPDLSFLTTVKSTKIRYSF